MTDNIGSDERQHGRDVFKVGETFPLDGEYVTVTDREVTDESPSDVRDDPDLRPECAKVVILTIKKTDGGETARGTATAITSALDEFFDGPGFVDVMAAPSDGNVQSSVSVSTNSSNKFNLTAEESADMAAFIREHAELELLYNLVGDIENTNEMIQFADALDRAAGTIEIMDQLD